MASGDRKDRLEILFLNLAHFDLMDQWYAALFDALLEKSKLKRAKTVNGATKYLEANNPKAILVSDEGLTLPQNRDVLDKVVTYVQNGLTAIFGQQFCRNTPRPTIDTFFKDTFGLPWTHSDMHWSGFEFNPSCTLPPGVKKESFPRAFYSKVYLFMNARPHEQIFVPAPGATADTIAGPGGPAEPDHYPIVGAKVGSGYVAHVGEIRADPAGDEIILALCGF